MMPWPTACRYGVGSDAGVPDPTQDKSKESAMARSKVTPVIGGHFKYITLGGTGDRQQDINGPWRK